MESFRSRFELKIVDHSQIHTLPPVASPPCTHSIALYIVLRQPSFAMWPSSLHSCSMGTLSHGRVCPASTSMRRRQTPQGNTHTLTQHTHAHTHTHTCPHTHSHNTHMHTPTHTCTHTHMQYCTHTVCSLLLQSYLCEDSFPGAG